MGLTGDLLLGTCAMCSFPRGPPCALSQCPLLWQVWACPCGPQKWPPSEAPFAVVSLAESGEGRAPVDLGSCHLSPLTAED